MSAVNAIELFPVTVVALWLYFVVLETGLISARLDFVVLEGLTPAWVDFVVMNLHLIPVPLKSSVIDSRLIAVELYLVAEEISPAYLRAFPLMILTVRSRRDK